MTFSKEVIKLREYLQLKNKPTMDDLKKYYNQKYYQEGKGSYELSYSKDEIEYFHNNSNRIIKICNTIFNNDLRGKAYLDLGCGEGWNLKKFEEQGCDVVGVDLSSYGILKNNPDMIAKFIESNIFSFLDDQITRGGISYSYSKQCYRTCFRA